MTKRLNSSTMHAFSYCGKILTKSGVFILLILLETTSCTSGKTAPEVEAIQPEQADIRVTEETSHLQPFLWSVRCEASSGQNCEGDPILSFPADRVYCRHDYQITEGPFGDTFQRVSVNGPDSLIVRVRAAGGPKWNPYASRIGLKIRGWGISKELGSEKKAALNCENETP